jgi:hypothetical protein
MSVPVIDGNVAAGKQLKRTARQSDERGQPHRDRDPDPHACEVRDRRR